MEIRTLFLALGWQLLAISSFGQGSPPWNNPLNIAWSSDGITFNTPTIFQDSSGVPSVIKWKGDTLIAAFQWFRQPNPSPTWDRVATKISFDNGLTWSQPTPIVVNGLPANHLRPFDPTLTVFNNDSLRIYFSSSSGTPIGLDSTVNTYSAKSSDGINFQFESGARVDELSNRVIDPAIIYFNSGWHYLSPIGSPQQGAYHYLSPDGLNFTPVSNIPSDNTHNWTGNYMIENNSELRFYGCGTNVWYKYSPNGGSWSGYVNTNIQGGDPSVVKTANNNYLIVYVGQPYNTGINDIIDKPAIQIFPNPAQNILNVETDAILIGFSFIVYDNTGKSVLTGNISSENTIIELGNLPGGIYLFSIGENLKQAFMVIKE